MKHQKFKKDFLFFELFFFWEKMRFAELLIGNKQELERRRLVTEITDQLSRKSRRISHFMACRIIHIMQRVDQNRDFNICELNEMVTIRSWI
jgi:hypothetical protein